MTTEMVAFCSFVDTNHVNMFSKRQVPLWAAPFSQILTVSFDSTKKILWKLQNYKLLHHIVKLAFIRVKKTQKWCFHASKLKDPHSFCSKNLQQPSTVMEDSDQQFVILFKYLQTTLIFKQLSGTLQMLLFSTRISLVQNSFHRCFS